MSFSIILSSSGQYTANLEFDGYWKNTSKIPNESGIYCVYSCPFNSRTNEYNVGNLLYIGKSEEARDRILKPGRIEKWKKKSNSDKLCFTFAPRTQYLQLLESILIYKIKPKLNKKTDNVPDLSTYSSKLKSVSISISGKNKGLTSNISFP